MLSLRLFEQHFVNTYGIITAIFVDVLLKCFNRCFNERCTLKCNECNIMQYVCDMANSSL